MTSITGLSPSGNHQGFASCSIWPPLVLPALLKWSNKSTLAFLTRPIPNAIIIQMKFIDTAKIKISSGRGGNGSVAWRREKFVPRGGPAGGDGGNGGSVYLLADPELSTLLDFKYKSIFKAKDGERGGTSNKTGKSGDDLIIKVPCGTIVKDLESETIIADLTKPHQKILVAQGGRGGRGNSHFATSTRHAPNFCEPGEPEIERELELELKLIAEVGIVGIPSAGKSTLISIISAAKPKIADYPFTTLTPNLGVVKKPNGDGVLVADIPGLIEGASEGHGLGHDFIKHIERTRILIHIIDGSGVNGTDPITAYDVIQNELKQYDKKILEKPQIIALNKIDLLDEETVDDLKKKFKKKKISPLMISCATKRNIDKLLNAMFEELEKNPKIEENEISEYVDPRATDHRFDEFSVYKDNLGYYVEGKKIYAQMSITDLQDFESTAHLMKIFKLLGVFDQLEKIGAKEGDNVFIGGIKFEFSPETLIVA